MSESSTENNSDAEHPWWWRIVTAIALGFIALGNFSDATLLIRDFGVEVYTWVSNDYEYQVLAGIHVGNTVAYVEEILGYPQVSRTIDDETTANYFFRGEYLLTLFYNSNRVSAYTWVSLDDGFAPEIDLRNGEVQPLGEFSFSTLPLEITGYTLDDSRIVRFYIESLEEGRTAGFLGTYLGRIQYGAFESKNAIAGLYQAEVMGDDEDVDSAKIHLRQEEIPNLYGRGNLPLEQIEKSILSNSEYAGYFGTN